MHRALMGTRISLSVVLLLALLGLFHHVLRSAVRQGDLRREATAQHASALFRCRELPDRRARDSCLHRLTAVPREGQRCVPADC